MDGADAQAAYAVLYYAALPVATVALLAALVLQGHFSAVTTSTAAVVWGSCSRG